MILLNTFYDGTLFTYVLLPLIIFFARITDVTIGTLRIVMVSKGQKYIAPFLGFFEVLIWLITMSKIVQNIDNWLCYVTYAAGFATGNYIGLLLEEKLAVGIVRIQIITKKEANDLVEKLKAQGYGITYLNAKGGVNNVSIIYTLLKRIDIPDVEKIITAYNPNAFYSVEDVKYVNRGILSTNKSFRWRKGK
jgi:uncharacterized protein YebE (UPF0316 family)